MKYFLVLCGTLLFSPIVFSQDWKEVRIDEKVSLESPTRIETIPNGNVNLYSSMTPSGTIVFFSESREQNLAKDLKEIEHSYDEYIRGFLSSTKGEIVKNDPFVINGVTGRYFRIRTPKNGGLILDSKIIILKGKIYSLQFTQTERFYSDTNEYRSRFLNSIKLADGLKQSDQYDPDFRGEDNFAYKLGYKLGGLLVTAAAVIFIIMLIARYRRPY